MQEDGVEPVVLDVLTRWVSHAARLTKERKHTLVSLHGQRLDQEVVHYHHAEVSMLAMHRLHLVASYDRQYDDDVSFVDGAGASRNTSENWVSAAPPPAVSRGRTATGRLVTSLTSVTRMAWVH